MNSTTTSLILNLLDNNFIGTLLAGCGIAFCGLFIYRYQKKIDIVYDDLRKVRELASLLFVEVEIASIKYENQLNIHDGKTPELRTLYDKVNEKFNQKLKNDFEDEFNAIVLKISKANENLTAHLKISGRYEEKIDTITKGIPLICFYFNTSSVLYLSRDNIDELRKSFHEIQRPIQEELQEIIKGISKKK